MLAVSNGRKIGREPTDRVAPLLSTTAPPPTKESQGREGSLRGAATQAAGRNPTSLSPRLLFRSLSCLVHPPLPLLRQGAQEGRGDGVLGAQGHRLEPGGVAVRARRDLRGNRGPALG
jgi:hypothetical protein